MYFFVRVVVQNEKYEDWRNTLISLRQVFVDYDEYLLNFHRLKFPNAKIPKAYVSTAAQGNFLEVLNMSLNVFEKVHFNFFLSSFQQYISIATLHITS